MRVDDQKDRDLVRQLRRDLEEYKRRGTESSSENNDLRKERDTLKIERNDLIITHAKEMEDERNNRRVINSENEKFKFKIKCLEDDLQKACLKAEKKVQEANALTSEKNSILGLLKEKEIMMDSMKRQVNELREELHIKEQEQDQYFRRQTDDERDRNT